MPITAKCLQCGADFKPRDKRIRYCSDACSQKAKLARTLKAVHRFRGTEPSLEHSVMQITPHNDLKDLQDFRDSLIQLHMKAKANDNELESELETLCLQLLRIFDKKNKPVMPITQSKEPKIVIENRLSTQQAKKLERLIEDTRNTDKDFSYTWEKLNSYLRELINEAQSKPVMPITQKPKPLRSTNDILAEIADRHDNPEKYEQKPKQSAKEKRMEKDLNKALASIW